MAVLRAIYFLITITLAAANYPHLHAQEVSNQAPQPAPQPASQTTAQPSSSSAPTDVPDAPSSNTYPDAIVLPDTSGDLVTIESDTQSKNGDHFILDGHVVITYKDRRVEADHIDFNNATGDLVATGHLRLTGGVNHEVIHASHGTLNIREQTGRFYDVNGSVGIKDAANRIFYANSNPFLFAGRMVVKTGPQSYDVYNGSVTSCQLPSPDWQLFAGKFSVDSEKASARNSTFRVLNIPVLFLPYVTHPVDVTARQSGFLIPIISQSNTKGWVLGEQIYWAISRSSDLTVGAEYFSLRGWQQMATYRYRGLGNNFATAHYSGLLDRGYYSNGVYVNQGGEDVTFAGRYDIPYDTPGPQTRMAANLEYLSSYVYREAFSENFNTAVSSDILSIGYFTHEDDGYSYSLRTDRYQGLKEVATTTTPEEQVRIFHAPSIDFTSVDHRIGDSPLLWSAESSIAGLKRVQPNFSTTGLTWRYDIHPELSLPLSFGNWHILPSVAMRDTIATRSREVPYNSPNPLESGEAVNRADFEASVDLRAPVIERTFSSPLVHKLFGSDVTHTIEPAITYRYVTGVDNFLQLLRFDDIDVVSNTNELQYGATQRIFLRTRKKPFKPCPAERPSAQDSTTASFDLTADQQPSTPPNCSNRELISWRLTQKYFFDPTFGNAVILQRRNIFTSTLDLSGVAFLTEPRNISPLISRLRIKPSDHFDFEWDFDYDTGAKKFTSNNVLIDLHEGNIFSGLSYARLNAPGRSYIAGFTSNISDFNQLKYLIGYGSPTRAGFGIAANINLDLHAIDSSVPLGLVQYAAIQTSYNWDCCGISVEYRKYELGSIRNEGTYRFNITLANIGTAGNLRRAERIF